MKKDSVLSVLDQVKINHTVRGILWGAAGIFGLFDNVICMAHHIVMLLLAIGCHIVLRMHKQEKSDEMSEANLNSARAYTLDFIQLVLLVIAVVVAVIPNRFLQILDWNHVLPGGLFIVLGLMDLAIGLTFKKLEKEE